MRRSDVELTGQPEDQRAVNALLRHLEAFVIELAHEPSSPDHDTAPKHRGNDSPAGEGHTRRAV